MSSLAFVGLFLLGIISCSAIRGGFNSFLDLFAGDAEFPGEKWALLIAGSAGYYNYRHQADICHAYQLLRQNGLKEENIVVFMADDIAFNPENPRYGTIINRPNGKDVYANVPKDYTGLNVTVDNFLAALKGDKSSIRGGSGKVIASGPNDHVFVFYSDHGGPGILGMPTYPFLFADDIVDTLIEKHQAKGFQHLVFYLEACESGSIFEGLLPRNISVYATTASNAVESSWGTYCPGMNPPPPEEFETCLGDLYSVAWMEDSEARNLAEESLQEQYQIVKERTSNHHTYGTGSHVMQYGDLKIQPQKASSFLGSNAASEGAPGGVAGGEGASSVQQRDADLLYFWTKYKNAPEGSPRKAEALKELNSMIAERTHVDNAMAHIHQQLTGAQNQPMAERPPGAPLVDDWSCFKAMVTSYESQCGRLSQYGMRHTAKLAALCNAGFSPGQLALSAGLFCAGTVPERLRISSQ